MIKYHTNLHLENYDNNYYSPQIERTNMVGDFLIKYCIYKLILKIIRNWFIYPDFYRANSNNSIKSKIKNHPAKPKYP